MRPAARRRSTPAPRCPCPSRSHRTSSPPRFGRCSRRTAWPVNLRGRAVATSDDGSSPDFLAGFLDASFAECDEHLTTVRRVLLAATAIPGRPSLSGAGLEELFRSFHSIKGLSGMVELRDAELLAHQMEEYLRRVRAHDVALTAEGVD